MSQKSEKISREDMVRDGPVRISMAGWLTKEGRIVKSWKKRWFMLRAGKLLYFKAQSDLFENLKGCIHLRNCEVYREDLQESSIPMNAPSSPSTFDDVEDDEEGVEDRDYTFKFVIRGKDRVLKCAARTSVDCDEWVHQIRREIAVMYYVENCQGHLRPIVAAIQGGGSEVVLDDNTLTLPDLKGFALFFAQPNLSCVSTLSLVNCGLTDVFMRPLGYCFRHNVSVEYLSIARNRITDVGLSELADGLFLNFTLVSLDVSENMIGDDGLILAGDLIRAHPSLNGLNVSKNMIESAGVVGFAPAVTYLTELDVSYNNVGDEGAVALAKTLGNTLESLSIAHGGVGATGMQALVNAVKNSNMMHTLDLRGNEAALVSATQARELVDSLKSLKNFKNLWLSSSDSASILALSDILKSRYQFARFVISKQTVKV